MKKKSSIVKLSIIGVVLILGLILSFCSFDFGLGKYNSFASAIKLGLDLKGGVYAVYEMQEGQSTDNLESRMEGTRTRLENLLVNKGYTEAVITKEGETRLRVEVPDVDDPNQIFDIIGKPATLRFELVKTEGTRSTILTGDNILEAKSQYSNSDGWVVSLKLDADGTKKFSDATTNNIGQTIEIISTVDGEDTTIAKPTVEAAITNGQAIINNMKDQETANNLADQITSGQFEVKLNLMESSTVSATLGDQALILGVIAGAVGLFLVMILLAFVYRGFGLIGCISLLLYVVLMFFFLAVLPWVQLTLPGIAGIVLSIGMAVDGNIIIYERIKDEYRNGKSILASSHAGFKKATIAIIDSNITTIIAAVVLLFFGTGSIKGFALTLLIGIVLSMFTSLLVNRVLVKNFTRINSTNANFYNLKRGKGFEDIQAGDDGVDIIEKSAKREPALSVKKEGGSAYENI